MKHKLQLLETHSNTAISWILQSKYDKLTLRKRRVNHLITLIAKSKNNIPNQYHSTHSFTKRQSTKAKLLSLNWKKEKYNASRFINWGSNSIEKKNEQGETEPQLREDNWRNPNKTYCPVWLSWKEERKEKEILRLPFFCIFVFPTKKLQNS